jgi:hypothetical protein
MLNRTRIPGATTTRDKPLKRFCRPGPDTSLKCVLKKPLVGKVDRIGQFHVLEAGPTFNCTRWKHSFRRPNRCGSIINL